MISQITSDNYEDIVSKNEKVLVIEFYRKSCGHCKMIQKELEELSVEREDVAFAQVDVEEEPLILQKLDIMSVPTVIFLKNGEMKEKLIGYYPKIIITENIKKLLR